MASTLPPGPPSPTVMASISTDPDTASASSDVVRDHSFSSLPPLHPPRQHLAQTAQTDQHNHLNQDGSQFDRDDTTVSGHPSRYRSQTIGSQTNVSVSVPVNNVKDDDDAPVSAVTSVPFSPGPAPTPFSGRPIKRKPVSSTASSVLAAITTTRSSASQAPSYVELPKPDHRFSRPPSVDSPTLYDYPSSSGLNGPAQPLDSHNPGTNLASTDATGSELQVNKDKPSDTASPSEGSDVLSVYGDLLSSGSDDAPYTAQDAHSQGDVEDDSSDDLELLYGNLTDTNQSPPMFAPKPTPPNLRLEKVDTTIDQEEPYLDIQAESPEASSPHPGKARPKSPNQASPLVNFFGWRNASPAGTEVSSIPGSPLSSTKNELANDASGSTDDAKTNASSTNPIGYCETQLSTPPPSNGFYPAQVDEMEDELKAISSELASSIRREMDLEDLVDRLQDQVSSGQPPSKRTSDYFSDSGYSSTKLSEHEQSREEIDKIQRRSEQEKASVRLELTNKLQDERTKRKALDQQIKELAEKASQVDLVQMNSMDANGRVKDLENTCEDLRRKLSEERQSKGSFEDLLGALKSQLNDVSNERDNLRDEVVPQLRARVEGLEAEAASHASLTYESTKMQHQLQSLKKENTSLRNSTIGGPEELLARSNSAAAASFLSQHAPLVGLSRSDSVKNAQPESREALAERLKDVEAQRDALHNALKNLLDRQEFQDRENHKKIKVLENERQRLLLESPKKAGFARDISNLRTEINVLRRRAEDALEQKWQVEKGLGGLKMDLDRAEEEIASLRSLLKEKDILIPDFLATSSGSGHQEEPISSESLQNTYKNMQSTYSASLERIKKLELGNGPGTSDEKTKLAMERLEQSLSAALSARDAAVQEVDGLKKRYEDLAASEAKHGEAERALADELSESAQRVEQLATQVRQQLSTNAELRSRLSDTVARGESDRKSNSSRISSLQERLRGLEDQLVTAQSASEERIGRHEDEIAKLREAHNEQLRRINGEPASSLKTPRKGSLLNPTAAAVFSRTTQIMTSKTFEEEAEMKTLRARVAELEKALADAEKEMQEVVARMSAAQIEVMNLQEERETAARETRRLQKLVQQEESKASEMRQ